MTADAVNVCFPITWEQGLHPDDDTNTDDFRLITTPLATRSCSRPELCKLLFSMIQAYLSI